MLSRKNIFQLLLNTTAGAGRSCLLNNKQTIKTVIENVKRHLGVDNLMVALARGSTMGKYSIQYIFFVNLASN